MYIEAYKESRRTSISLSGLESNLVFFVCDDDPNAPWANPDAGTEIFGDGTDNQALNYAYGFIPADRIVPLPSGGTFTLRLVGVECTEHSLGVYKIEASYSNAIPGTACTISYTNKGATKKITQSYGIIQTNTHPNYAGAAPNPQNVIGATRDGIEGVEVPAPNLNLSVTTFLLPAVAYSVAYVQVLANLKGKVNNAPFLGFAPGTMMFLGADAQGTTYDYVPMTFEFDVKENLVAVDMLDGFPPVTMLGHDVIDYRYADAFDENQRLAWPVVRYVHRVAQSADFDALAFTCI